VAKGANWAELVLGCWAAVNKAKRAVAVSGRQEAAGTGLQCLWSRLLCNQSPKTAAGARDRTAARCLLAWGDTGLTRAASVSSDGGMDTHRGGVKVAGQPVFGYGRRFVPDLGDARIEIAASAPTPSIEIRRRSNAGVCRRSLGLCTDPT
jgi:hypothetical protein